MCGHFLNPDKLYVFGVCIAIIFLHFCTLELGHKNVPKLSKAYKWASQCLNMLKNTGALLDTGHKKRLMDKKKMREQTR